jgi:hypothetical protein
MPDLDLLSERFLMSLEAQESGLGLPRISTQTFVGSINQPASQLGAARPRRLFFLYAMHPL